MNARRLFPCLCLLAGLGLRAAEPGPTVDLYAGWSWWPAAPDYPYAYYAPLWDAWREPPYGWRGYAARPYLRGAGPADGCWPWGWGYGYPYYGWGFGYGTRLRLYPGAGAFPDAPDAPLLPPPAGAAPTDLRDPAADAAWERTVRDFLGALPPHALRPEGAAATNAPAR